MFRADGKDLYVGGEHILRHGGNGGEKLFSELRLGKDGADGFAAGLRANDDLAHHQKSRQNSEAVKRACHLGEPEAAMIRIRASLLQRRTGAKAVAFLALLKFAGKRMHVGAKRGGLLGIGGNLLEIRIVK